MRNYFIKTPWWLKRMYSGYVWSMPSREKKVYLTFDDGPHPTATPFVLDQLKQYDIKATFFCIGKNVVAFPELYRRIIDEGHAVGNHTQHHYNGWKTADATYLEDVREAATYIDSNLFRPPYGRITSFQARHVPSAMNKQDVKVIMWDVISGDFDVSLKGEQCLQHVILNARNGSIIVFHDSEKAFDRLSYALPKAIEFFIARGMKMERLQLF